VVLADARQNNELKHSMRSVLESLSGHIGTVHLLTADYPFEYPNDVPLVPEDVLAKMGDPSVALSTWRIAQTPTWLNFAHLDPASPSHPYHPASTDALLGRKGQLTKQELQFPRFRYAVHSEVFHLPTVERDAVTEELGEREWTEREWRRMALPTYNSMAIESRIGWMPGLVRACLCEADFKADVALAMNDDFFILRPHAVSDCGGQCSLQVSDFHSPLYGSVIRFDHGWYQQVRPILDKTRINDAGEAGGLYHANYVLSKRFPRRLRPYFAHTPKVITRGLHHEASLIFKEDLFTSSRRRFREVTHGEGDIQMQWLLTSLRVGSGWVLR
jgi:3-O-alpha-D-mannopyranosyl-alpha-D-mannopyranose xylosylphosphotransferase